jgi:hypothetical protein
MTAEIWGLSITSLTGGLKASLFRIEKKISAVA